MTGRDTINAAFDEIDYICELAYSAKSGLEKALKAVDDDNPDYKGLESGLEAITAAYYNLDELRTYLS